MDIVGDQYQAGRPGLAGDHHVIGADGLSSPVEVGSNLPEVICGAGIEGQDFKPGGQPLDVGQIAIDLPGVLGAEDEFAHGDGGDPDSSGMLLKAAFHLPGTVFHRVDDRGGIQQVLEHQKRSRCWSAGCDRVVIKSGETPAASNHSSQD